MTDNNTIIFRMGEETGIVIEKTEEQFKNSLFREQYRQVFGILDTIIERSTRTESHKDIDNKMSNIIVFCGDRGEGKTSALETVRCILSNKTIMKEAQSAKLYTSKNIDSDSFKVLRLVDPAFFDNKHNLLELLIGQMYSDICDDDRRKMEEDECSNRCNENIANRNRLMENFQKVKKSLAIINKASDKNAYDDLEEIDDLAAGIELKDKFNKLLHCYADYFHKERVLISIDDLDLNATEGYQMAEEIRKYLSSPENCVVLMAVKIEQMIGVIQSYLRKRMDKEVIPNETIKEMAIKYVMKLMPESHRVLMPSGEDVVEKRVILEDKKEDQETFTSVKEAVVRYIYKKTGYIFVNGRNISPIVPMNLRSVRLLLGMLWQMSNSKDEYGFDIVSNKEIFKTYFFNTWTKNLSTEDAVFAQSLAGNEDIVSINKSVVMHLGEIILSKEEKKREAFEKKNTIVNAILNPQNAMQNISLGDVFYVMNYVETISASIESKNLLSFLREYYSIKLYDTYNFISESESNLFPNPKDNVAIYKYDTELQKRNLLQRLVNGSYFTYEAGTLTPTDKRKIPRDKRIINGKDLIEKFKSLNLKSSAKMWNLCEFFALTSTRPVYAGGDVDYDRTLTSRSYFDTFKETNNYIVFDALSIFYNIINIKQTYQRWNEVYKGGSKDFYADALAYKDSLLNKMLNTCYKKHPWSPSTDLNDYMHRFVSEAILRFSEVQLTILDNLINRRDSAKTGGNLFNIHNSYQYIRDLGIKLYPIKDDGAYEMEFWFLKPIIEFLSDEKQVAEEDFNKIFQVEITNKKIINTIERAFNGSILGLGATSSATGIELREKIAQLDDADLYEDINWEDLFDEKQIYSRKDVIAIMSQSNIYEELRNISISKRTREEAAQRATLRAIHEVNKILNGYTTEFSRQIKQIEKQISSLNREDKSVSKKKTSGRLKKNETTVVIVEPQKEGLQKTEK